MAGNPRFYMVWNPNGRAPTYRHDTYPQAMAEARRLAGLNPSEQFVVLAAVATAKVRDPIMVIPFEGAFTVAAMEEDDEIPF